MKNKYISLGLLLLLGVALIVVPGATAKSTYFSALQSVYGTSGTSCNTCHSSIPNLNDYGNKFASVSTHGSDPSGALKSIGAPPGVTVPTPTPAPTPAPSPDPAVLKKITVAPLTANLGINEVKLFNAAPGDQNGNPISAEITWTSSNTTVGTIDSSGKFTALQEGTTTVTASSGDVSGSAQITVTSEKSNKNGENKKHKEHKEHREHSECKEHDEHEEHEENHEHKNHDELEEHKEKERHHEENESDEKDEDEHDDD